RYLREYQSLGTGGGLYHFRDEITRGNPDNVFVLNADIASSFPLAEMLSFHEKQKGVGTILASRVPRDEVHKYGCVVANPDTHEVLHFVEKPETFMSDLISCGIYLFTKDIFPVMSAAIEKRRADLLESGDDAVRSASDEKVALEQDVLSLLASEMKLFAYVCDPKRDFWMQIKTGSSAIPANRKYLQHFVRAAPRRLSEAPLPSADLLVAEPAARAEVVQPAYIHPSAQIHPTARLGPNVSIGPRVTIARGVRIRDSIILDNVDIKNDSCILNSIVGWDSKIGCWARVEGAAPAAAAPVGAATAKGMKVPSACIIGKDVVIADEITVRNCIVLPHKEIKSSQHNEILM
ncbi:nucleotide-diphospho-sugar transferase, partial [Blyttiomyces helicus]